jgi:hypothetical protein
MKLKIDRILFTTSSFVMTRTTRKWSVVGCRHYAVVPPIDARVEIRLDPSQQHPWRISAFYQGQCIGTLPAARIQRLFPLLRDGAFGILDATVISRGRNNRDECNLLEVMVRIQLLLPTNERTREIMTVIEKAIS